MSDSADFTPFPHQTTGYAGLRRAVGQGHKGVICYGPTGSGKTNLMAMVASGAQEKGNGVLILSSRRIPLAQHKRALDAHGVVHGTMASGYQPATLRDVQVGTVQTIGSRVFGSEKWEMPDSDVVLVDEIHGMMNASGLRIIDHYLAKGVPVIGFTATPVGICPKRFAVMVEAGRVELLQAGGYLVTGDLFYFGEPDLKGVRMNSHGEYGAGTATRRMMECLILGDVFEKYDELNPRRLPSVLWAPDVATSEEFASQFRERGITAAHIDGDKIVLADDTVKSTPENRQQVFDDHERGQITMICSCGVLREAWDAPWVCHGILLQTCGGIDTYLQIVGRLKRPYPGKQKYTLQDHSGSIWRHGSPDIDRHWVLGEGNREIAKKLKGMREKGETKEMICCPKCGAVRPEGNFCPYCGNEHKKSFRVLRFADGTTRRVSWSLPKVRQKSAEEREWISTLFRCANARRPMTFRQAAGIYKRSTGEYVPAKFPHVPKVGDPRWNMPVAAVLPQFRRRGGKAKSGGE